MEGLSRAAGSPVVWTINGQEYELCPLTLRDIGTVEQHLLSQRVNPLKAVSEVYNDLPKEKAEELLERAYADLKSANKVTTGEIQAFFNTVEGQKFTMWLSMRHSRPKLTLLDVEKLIESLKPEEIEALLAAKDQASGTDVRGNSTGQEA